MIGSGEICPERLCKLMSIINTSSFRSTGPTRMDEKQFEIFGGGAPSAKIEKSSSSDCADWCLVPSQHVSKQLVEKCKTRSKQWKLWSPILCSFERTNNKSVLTLRYSISLSSRSASLCMSRPRSDASMVRHAERWWKAFLAAATALSTSAWRLHTNMKILVIDIQGPRQLEKYTVMILCHTILPFLYIYFFIEYRQDVHAVTTRRYTRQNIHTERWILWTKVFDAADTSEEDDGSSFRALVLQVTLYS